MLVVLLLVLSALFGAADQYLGSLPGAHLWAAQMPWLTDVSLLSAPWVLLPFLVGATHAGREGPRSSDSPARCSRSSGTQR
jgi:hypothetical protein